MIGVNSNDFLFEAFSDKKNIGAISRKIQSVEPQNISQHALQGFNLE